MLDSYEDMVSLGIPPSIASDILKEESRARKEQALSEPLIPMSAPEPPNIPKYVDTGSGQKYKSDALSALKEQNPLAKILAEAEPGSSLGDFSTGMQRGLMLGYGLKGVQVNHPYLEWAGEAAGSAPFFSAGGYGVAKLFPKASALLKASITGGAGMAAWKADTPEQRAINTAMGASGPFALSGLGRGLTKLFKKRVPVEPPPTEDVTREMEHPAPLPRKVKKTVDIPGAGKTEVHVSQGEPQKPTVEQVKEMLDNGIPRDEIRKMTQDDAESVIKPRGKGRPRSTDYLNKVMKKETSDEDAIKLASKKIEREKNVPLEAAIKQARTMLGENRFRLRAIAANEYKQFAVGAGIRSGVRGSVKGPRKVKLVNASPVLEKGPAAIASSVGEELKVAAPPPESPAQSFSRLKKEAEAKGYAAVTPMSGGRVTGLELHGVDGIHQFKNLEEMHGFLSTKLPQPQQAVEIHTTSGAGTQSTIDKVIHGAELNGDDHVNLQKQSLRTTAGSIEEQVPKGVTDLESTPSVRLGPRVGPDGKAVAVRRLGSIENLHSNQEETDAIEQITEAGYDWYEVETPSGTKHLLYFKEMTDDIQRLIEMYKIIQEDGPKALNPDFHKELGIAMGKTVEEATVFANAIKELK